MGISVTSMVVQLWTSNNNLRDNDVKIRMVRLLYPKVWIDVDTVYSDAPERIRFWVQNEENRLIAIKKAEGNAKRISEQAERAKLILDKLKKQ
ncbi:hypothetical protein [Sphingobacterium hungaricum]|uniref:hypothetical protein n=1 Tax=Sphingobacterium hungaricum TaxID=2082723 RepID=UPI001E2A4663|nr:hypothetical protein [Sphingobacterium hungaricum]